MPHAEGTIGDRTGPLCKNCAHYCDGNITTIELGPEAIAKFQFAKVIADASVLVDEHDGHISCTPEGCVLR